MKDRTDRAKLPKIFFVNWFRKDDSGRWLWPGFGENSRVLKWICERIDGTGKAKETPIGHLPTPDALDMTGLTMAESDLKTLLEVDIEGWKKEIDDVAKSYEQLGERLPEALKQQLTELRTRLDRA
jgi:phosphoenolpyruvate carboxykinase (GTP)